MTHEKTHTHTHTHFFDINCAYYQMHDVVNGEGNDSEIYIYIYIEIDFKSTS